MWQCLLSCEICYSCVWWKREELEWYFNWNSYIGIVSTTLISLCWLSCSTGRVQRAVLPLAHFRQRNGARPHTRQQITISCATIDCATISSWHINITMATSGIDSGMSVSVSISYCVSNARRAPARVAPCRKQRDLSHVAYHALYDPEFLIQLLHLVVENVVLFLVVRQE